MIISVWHINQYFGSRSFNFLVMRVLKLMTSGLMELMLFVFFSRYSLKSLL